MLDASSPGAVVVGLRPPPVVTLEKTRPEQGREGVQPLDTEDRPADLALGNGAGGRPLAPDLNVAAIGASPHGLSPAVHLRRAGVEAQVFGETMPFGVGCRGT
jgi:hypothetical protein